MRLVSQENGKYLVSIWCQNLQIGKKIWIIAFDCLEIYRVSVLDVSILCS